MSTSVGVYYMRAAPATGALYPIELYVICSEIPGLKAGVYHFNPFDFALVKLREGDFTAHLAASIGLTGSAFPLTIAFTSIAWRNAWKYEARSYRHWFWDSGVIVANLLATSSAEDLAIRIDLGFVDSQLANLLGLTRGQEAPVALAHIGKARKTSDSKPSEIPLIDQAVKPLFKSNTQ